MSLNRKELNMHLKYISLLLAAANLKRMAMRFFKHF